FFGAAPFDAGRFVRDPGIRKSAAHHTGPTQGVGFEGRGRANVGLGIEAQAHPLEHLPDAAHHRRIEVFLAQAVEAGVTLDAFRRVHGRAFDRGIDVDGTHRANVRAVTARYTLFGIDLHAFTLSALNSSTADRFGSIRVASTAAMTHSWLATT